MSREKGFKYIKITAHSSCNGKPFADILYDSSGQEKSFSDDKMDHAEKVALVGLDRYLEAKRVYLRNLYNYNSE